MTRQTLITQSEEPAEFTALFDSYWEQLKPEGPQEIDVFADIVAARWRLCRIWTFTTALLDIEMNQQNEELSKRYRNVDPGMRGGAAFKSLTTGQGTVNTAIRMEEHLHRIYYRATKNFKQLQKERKQA
jgi:hypothetical protein